MKQALFLDRDGILNEVVIRGDDISSPRTVGEFRLIREGAWLVEQAKELGFLCVVITNQPDISNGLMSPEALEWINQRLLDLGVEAIECCESADDSDRRRKPNPGMLFDAAYKLEIDLKRSYFVGDHLRDVQAGKAAGVKTIFLETEYNRSFHGCGDINCRSLTEIPAAIYAQLRDGA